MFISFVDCIQNIEKIEKELLKIGITDIQINQDGYINSLYWLKVKYPNANKGDAITFIKNHVACDYTVSFGNETNDIEMFLASDISICVVNAYNVIKDIADYGKISITIADDILELFEKEYHRYLENVVIALPEDKIIIENVLYKPEIKAQIDIEKNPEGFVKYPNSQGGKYLFLASKTKEYFKSHFREIMIDV
ncbi:DUF771 domain-containing protein [Streptococcus mutans]|uniref:DUF771 domain-containing protein n=2 Tax=Streptococcus mutans TaxID=1309 RepID=UPI0002B56346|nr:DUF771 domain-containing protein [Streptococcus mutans]EMB98384.1 hypothetical protein SMU66_09235 [Streptococcus mutans N34]MBT3148202.1 DUF771 domain-containing protein [Streptococcus mutans]MBW3480089.1 DUF771 domain-containing protein [Streptococcus mutans]MCB4931888.1 DUF771 domain-containing protein [Streptococcus mutans]MCB5110310.1 DUF771 domain-containing protein [Streptococcus mutans]